MRGKKSNPEFISQYMQGCIACGLSDPADIVQAAHEEIDVIDQKIKEVELLKIRRSNLLDVIETFDKSKGDKTQEAKLLPLFEVKYPQTCKKICDSLLKGPLSIPSLDYEQEYEVYNFCIKQLLEHKIITRIDDLIVCGERFQEYVKFILRETT